MNVQIIDTDFHYFMNNQMEVYQETHLPIFIGV